MQAEMTKKNALFPGKEMDICAGLCANRIYENNGVCNVPAECAVGTDCADCEQKFPLLQIISSIASFVLVISILSLVCIRSGKQRASKAKLLSQVDQPLETRAMGAIVSSLDRT